MIIESSFPTKQHEGLKSIFHTSEVLKAIHIKCNWFEETIQHINIFSVLISINTVILIYSTFSQTFRYSIKSSSSIVWNGVLFIKHT